MMISCLQISLNMMDCIVHSCGCLCLRRERKYVVECSKKKERKGGKHVAVISAYIGFFLACGGTAFKFNIWQFCVYKYHWTWWIALYACPLMWVCVFGGREKNVADCSKKKERKERKGKHVAEDLSKLNISLAHALE